MGIFDMLLFHSTIQSVTPILLAALAGLICERAGIFTIAQEGLMLAGAFAAVAGSWFCGGAWAGVLIAIATSVVLSGILAGGGVLFLGDTIVIGIGINLLADGLSIFLLRQLFDIQGVFEDPKLDGLDALRIPVIADIPGIGGVISGQTWITYLSWLLVAAVSIFLFRTTWGLRLRGVGEQGEAAETLGVSVRRYRAAAILVSGALCGLAGAQLSLGAVTLFSEGMSAGRGWIAVVAVMLGRANPLGVLGASVLFGLADAVGLRMQGLGLPNQLTDAAPYVITLIALILAVRRHRLA
ncbi:MAG TPA: ABC transporter permease [Magnetospirillaceae bacterium]|jgi:simple sugar transport system permease protein